MGMRTIMENKNSTIGSRDLGIEVQHINRSIHDLTPIDKPLIVQGAS